MNKTTDKNARETPMPRSGNQENPAGNLLSGCLMTGSGMTGPGLPHNSTLLPVNLVFYVGNYAEGSFSVRWNGDSLVVEETGGGNFSSTPRAVTPGPDRWETFWKEIDDIGVWSWDNSYTNPHGCCGVTYWQLVLDTGVRAISCSGEDRFPGSASPGQNPGFRALVSAIKTLCGSGP